MYVSLCNTIKIYNFLKMPIIQKIRIILVNTTHPGNIGAVARAMKNMELARLYLVNPLYFPHAEVTARAAGADDILQNAVVTESLLEAIQDCQLVIGTSSRVRALPIVLLDPKEAVAKAIVEAKAGHEVALVFGTESSGLSNEELKLCHYHMHIPTNTEFASLNLAAAVLIIAYEIKMALAKAEEGEEGGDVFGLVQQMPELATVIDQECFYTHLEEVLIQSNFLDPKKPRHLMERMRRMFGRARLEKAEINIWRGVLTELQKKLK